MRKLNVYFSSGWFSESQEKICTKLENYLRSKDGIIPYFPRHDGIKLEPGQFHDPNLRKKVFLDNVYNIDKADFIVTNLDSTEGFLDTGTIWEDGYAAAKGIPVIAYQDVISSEFTRLVGSISNKFVSVCVGLDELDSAINKMKSRESSILYTRLKNYSKILLVSPDNTKENIDKSTEVASILVEGYGKNFKWVDNLSNADVGSNVEDIFKDIECMVAVIDDRHPVVSWLMGQAYARHIPTISYTNYDFGVNLMLAVSILQHVKGISNLKELIQHIKREGISSIDPYDNSGLKVF